MITKVAATPDGRFVAAYACPVGELGERFVGCFKVFRERPRCFCESGYLVSSIAPGDFADADAALRAAFLSAGEHPQAIADADAATMRDTAEAQRGSPPTRARCLR